ncbi:hypothetical protein BD769DRAFT_1393275 [Suillus cothurnatus]|nr:hypothetical protein BD769DRAFT_1393275 [Suillus cothurnatus]
MKIQMLRDELLNHGNEPFDLSIPPVCGVYPSLTEGRRYREIARDTDAGHAQTAENMTNRTLSHLSDAVQRFQSVLDQCPVGVQRLSPTSRMRALNTIFKTILKTFILLLPSSVTPLHYVLRVILITRHASSLHDLIRVLDWHYSKELTAVYLHESAQLRCKLSLLCPEGTYLRSMRIDGTVDYVIKNLPINTSDECIHLLQNILEFCPADQQHRPKVLDKLAWALRSRFTQHGNIDDIDKTAHLTTLTISLYGEALRLCPVGHDSRDLLLGNLGGAFLTRFNKHRDIDDITRAISLRREALALCPPGHPSRDTTLNSLALTLDAIYIWRYQESLAALSSLHPSWFFSYARLQEAKLPRYRILHDPVGLSLAVENFRLASSHPTQRFQKRIIQLLGARLTTWSSTNSRREAAAAFHYARTLPIDTASCTIRCDNLRHAVELVGQGRGQQWSLASRLKTPDEDLESANPKLAHDYLELRSSATVTDRAAADRAATKYGKITGQWRRSHAGRCTRRFAVEHDREQPYNLCFAMRHKPFTLLDIMENNSSQAEFVFRSACHTAVSDEETPDEAIHLAAELQFFGFKSVIGTLWAFNDALAKHVFEAFYKKLFGDLEDWWCYGLSHPSLQYKLLIFHVVGAPGPFLGTCPTPIVYS